MAAYNRIMVDLRACFPSLSVVIPAYNASDCLVETLDDVFHWLNSAGMPSEVIVVDDGSQDDTVALVQEYGNGVRLLKNKVNRGKGFSVRQGMLATRFEWALFMDVDNSTRIAHLEQFAAHADHADILIGSRRIAGACIARKQHPIRQFLGRCFPYLVRALALKDVQDTQCGFKIFRRPVVDRVFPRQTVERFAFDVELLMLARRMGYSIREVPVDWDNPVASTLNVNSDTFQMLCDLLRITYKYRIRNWSDE